MFGFLKECTYLKAPLEKFAVKKNPIGVDVGSESLKLVQLKDSGKGTALVSGGRADRPSDITPGSAEWQRWAIEAVKGLIVKHKFQGREIVAALPSEQIFIDYIKLPKTGSASRPIPRETIISKLKGKLVFDPDATLIKYSPAEAGNVMVMAVERRIIDRHLAIYEKANLQIKCIADWPSAMANTYVRFFGRRESDVDAVVMLVCIESNCTNVVICRHKSVLFAHSIPLGSNQLEIISTDEVFQSAAYNQERASRLAIELTSSRRQFSSMYKDAVIQRLIFLSGGVVNKEIYMAMAKQLQMPAQIGDCLAAVQITNPENCGIDRRNYRDNWTVVFGLSLS